MDDNPHAARRGPVSGVECRQPVMKAQPYKGIILPRSGGAGPIPHYRDDLWLLRTLA